MHLLPFPKHNRNDDGAPGETRPAFGSRVGRDLRARRSHRISQGTGINHTFLGLLAALVFAAGASCKKSETSVPPATRAASALSPDNVARVHWLGKQSLGVQASAYYFMRLWGLPESAKLEAQTLDKLSLAPWRLLRGEPAVANAPTALVRPLLENLLMAESYLEARQSAARPIEVAWAIRTDDPHADLWRTNLAVVVASLTGIQTLVLQDGGRGWSMTNQDASKLVQLTRVGEWTVAGVAQHTNALLNEFVARIQRDGAPFAARATNFWLQADLDLSRVAGALSNTWNLTADLPRISVRVTGDGGNVLTSGDLTFAKPLQLELEPWNIPTNLIREPLATFTAARGFKPWLAGQKFWTDLSLGTPPGQFYFWALQGVPYQTYFAAPLPDASNRVQQLTGHLMEKANPWLASHNYVSFERSPDSNGATWGKLPSVLPFIKSVGVGPGAMVFGGLLADAGADTHRPLPAGLIQDVLQRTNLVYYDWEITGPRIDSCLYLGQFLRQISRHASLPLDSASAALLGPLVIRLASCATLVTYTGTNQLSFIRKSTAGFTGAELHLLADWLESPQFPRGLHTFLAPPDAPPVGGPPPTVPPAKP